MEAHMTAKSKNATNQDLLSFQDVRVEEYKKLRPRPEGEVASGAELLQKMENEEAPLSALCISGGGIRSATFALGALQGLADKGLLGGFDYLSTVSGGGYIGSWLTAWKHRCGGLEKILPALKTSVASAQQGGPEAIQHLREYNNYLSPKIGLFSADTWTLVATVLRNMLLNWLVLVPLMMAALMAPRLVLSLTEFGLQQGAIYCGTPVDRGVDLALSLLAGALFAVAIFNTLRYLPSVGNKNHSQADYLKSVFLPLVAAVLVFASMYTWLYVSPPTGGECGAPSDTRPPWHFLAWAVGSCAAGWAAYVIFYFKVIRAKGVKFFSGLTFAILLTGSCTGLGAWLLVIKIFPGVGWPAYVATGAPMVVLSFMGAVTLVVGISSFVLSDEDREWLSRAAAWLLLFVLGWGALCTLVLLAPHWAIFSVNKWGRAALATAGAGGGWLTALGGLSSKTRATKQDPDGKRKQNGKLTSLVLHLAALLFIVVVLVGLTLLTNWILSVTGSVQQQWWDHEELLENTDTLLVILFAALFAAIGVIMARFININRFSLHAMYRNRLIRAYLGASNGDHDRSRFMGFADSDNFPMCELKAEQKPFHVVNITLNLVRGKRLAWQQRKAETFTISPLHCGSSAMNSFRRSSVYGDRDGLTLGTAVTISGAAASPNMGYHSSPLIGFIMTLFNARLGAWLGNPARKENVWNKSGPTSAVRSMVSEALGLTDDTNKWIYLSDGGHFENLGLYEMVRRGGRNIVVLDGGCDAEFTYEDLGNALRKIRIDLGVTIDFGGAMKPLLAQQKRCAVANIGYKAAGWPGEDGKLLYIKPVILGDEPPDVAAYKAANEDFPHQSTADQWFDESQTESYRMLGLHTINALCQGWEAEQPLRDLIEHVEDSYLGLAGTATAQAKGAGQAAGK
jgi:Patatin-like phospholipase